MIRFLKKHSFLITVFILVIIFRLPSLFEPYWHGDEGITLAVGQGLQRGAVLYRDIDDNKTPLLYFLASLVDNLAQFKFLLMLWSLLTVLIFYQLARNFLSGKLLLTTTLIFVVLTDTPLLEGNIINAEIFFLLPIISGMLFLGKEKFFLSGVFFALAFLFKVPALLDFLAAVFFIFITKSNLWRDKLWRLLFGFSLPLLLVIVYFWFNQALSFFLQSVFLDNTFYASSWDLALLTSRQYLVLRTAALLLVLLWLKQKIKDYGQSLTLILLWFFFSLYGTTLSSRPYTHYLMQTMPAFVLAMFVSGQRGRKLLLLVLSSLLSIIFLQFTAFQGPFWQANIFYYQRFWQYAVGQISTKDYQRSFDEKTAQTYRLSSFLQQNSRFNEPIFYWGDNALIYALSQRPPATRLTTAYNIRARQREKETLLKLKEILPRLILISVEHERLWPQLLNFVLSEYQLIKVIEGVKIYEKKAIAV